MKISNNFSQHDLANENENFTGNDFQIYFITKVQKHYITLCYTINGLNVSNVWSSSAAKTLRNVPQPREVSWQLRKFYFKNK